MEWISPCQKFAESCESQQTHVTALGIYGETKFCQLYVASEVIVHLNR